MNDVARIARKIAQQIAEEIAASANQVGAAIGLLDDGATVPFIARYRKEVTGGLDDIQLRTLELRLTYLRELEDRRAAVLSSIAEQGKLSDTLRDEIVAADTKSRLEDLYLPYKPKRRTRAQIAREAGLEPLLDALIANPAQDPEALAASYVNADNALADSKAALDGARQILLERVGEHAGLLGELRQWLAEIGQIRSRVSDGKQAEGAKYRDYFDRAEALAAIPSHRLLALFRARNEGVLMLDLEPGSQPEQGHAEAVARVAKALGIAQRARPADAWLFESCRLAWKVKLHLNLMLDLFMQARERAEAEAIRVFGDNLKDLLLAAPAGPRAVMGLDPGLRTGVKVAVVDRTGKLVDTATIYPHAPSNRWNDALVVLGRLAIAHQVELIAIGNGTASRETDKLAADLLKQLPQLKAQKIVVSEAGASVYSASELASKEFPDIDVSLRGAVSIARRLQDPLAELVKIEPKAIGVGQYQHDVDQSRLAKALEARVEDCVNAVGVHVNTASAALLSRVSGVSAAVAENIVSYRDQHGAFKRRRDLLKVPRLGDKSFEQAAGFLRIADGDDPLDASSVHPEAYPVVERMLATVGKPVRSVIGDVATLRALRAEQFTDSRFGLPTVRDILQELEKPGRDPRPEFRAAQLADGIEKVSDLTPGMVLEGTVSNVAAFGAFVDIGVHQDGLVHVSALSTRFVKDPREVVKAGDIVKVKVLEVDIPRQRIALTLRLDDPLPDAGATTASTRGATARPRESRPTQHPAAERPRNAAQSAKASAPAGGNALADAFAKAKQRGV